MVFVGNFQAAARLYIGLFPVKIVNLQLYKIQLVGILREDFVKKLRRIVEGHTGVFYFPFCFFGGNKIKRSVFAAFFIYNTTVAL